MEMQKITVCTSSGYRNTSNCNETDTLWVARKGLQSTACTYHKKVHLSIDSKFRLHSNCAEISDIKESNWFVLPPIQEYYFRNKNLSYRTLPPFRADCISVATHSTMDLIYPKPNAKIFIPRRLDGTLGSSVFQLAHSDPSATVFWHLDEAFIGTTLGTHQLSINTSKGKHKITVVDEHGESLEQFFEVLSKM